MSAGESGRGSAVGRVATASRAVVLATVALAGSIVTLLFTLVPDLKPDPHEKVGAAVDIVAVERNVSVRQWLHRAFPGDVDGAAEKLFGKHPVVPGYHGEVVYVRVQVDGFKHGHVFLAVRLYDARTQSVVELPSTPIDPARFATLSSRKIDAPSRSSIQVLFLPNLAGTPHYFLRAELYETGGVLALADSPTLIHGLIPHKL
jgi:hypothetical protein